MDIVFTFSDNKLTVYINDKTCIFNLEKLGYDVNLPVSRGQLANHLIKDQVIDPIKNDISRQLNFFQRAFYRKRLFIISNKPISNLAAKLYMDLAEFVLGNLVYIKVTVDEHMPDGVGRTLLLAAAKDMIATAQRRPGRNDVYNNGDASIENS